MLRRLRQVFGRRASRSVTTSAPAPVPLTVPPRGQNWRAVAPPAGVWRDISLTTRFEPELATRRSFDLTRVHRASESSSPAVSRVATPIRYPPPPSGHGHALTESPTGVMAEDAVQVARALDAGGEAAAAPSPDDGAAPPTLDVGAARGPVG